jgi:hypothetical protein
MSICQFMTDNASRVPTWPTTILAGTPTPFARTYTAFGPDTQKGHVSPERAQRAEAAPGCYTASAPDQPTRAHRLGHPRAVRRRPSQRHPRGLRVASPYRARCSRDVG